MYKNNFILRSVTRHLYKYTNIKNTRLIRICCEKNKDFKKNKNSHHNVSSLRLYWHCNNKNKKNN